MKSINTIVHPNASTLTTEIIMLEKTDEVFQQCLAEDKNFVEKTLEKNPNADVSDYMNDDTEALYYYDVNGDYLINLEDIVKEAKSHLQYIYSGEAEKDRIADSRISQQERCAESYGESRLYGQ